MSDDPAGPASDSPSDGAPRSMGEILADALAASREPTEAADVETVEWPDEHQLGLMAQALKEPIALLQDAAFGSSDAHRAIADAALTACQGQQTQNAHIIIIEGLVFARLAAAEGEARDLWRVVMMLERAAQLWGPESEDDLLGEAIGWVQHLADQGNERAANLLNKLADEATPAMLNIAKGYAERLALHKYGEL